MNALCRIELLGGLHLTVCDQPVTHFRTRKTADLLAYLAYHLFQNHPRELLIDLFWPECDVEAGRHNLSVALSSLRRQLEPPGVLADGSVLLADRHAVRLNAETVRTDVAEFETALKTATQAETGAPCAQALAVAVDLYGGDLLPGSYDEWIFPEQQHLQELFFQSLHRLVACLEEDGDREGALRYALRAIREDPLREEAHRDVIRLYLASGQPESALRQYAELERRLQQELDVAPGEETQSLMRALRETSRLPAALQPEAASPIGSPPPPAIDLLEPVGGAVPLHSRFYVLRPTDEEFQAAITRRDSIVLVKGPRQVGKTSLLARGLQQARESGARVALSHLQMLNTPHLESADTLLLALAETLCEQLELEVQPADVWDLRRGASPNFRRYLRRTVLPALQGPLVWGLDEVDRLFACPFASDVFGLFRSWHDERALDPQGPWEALTLAIAYSTEAHLFITDINQSPFNVGTRLTLQDFTQEQVADLNQRYGAPLRAAGELARFFDLVGGHPYLVRRGLHELASHGCGLELFEKMAITEHWIYGDHLRRISVLTVRDAGLSDTLREVLAGRPCPARDSFYRLRSAGVLAGEDPSEAHFRSRLYARYLAQHFSCTG
jgi:DNA-binding SARP family transcriptional activator